MVRDVRLEQSIRVLGTRVVVRESFGDVRAHDRLLAALLVVVAGGEGRLAEAGDGEILFFGVCGEGNAWEGFFERLYGAFEGFGCFAGGAGAGCLASDGRYG
jgi:hypothetical protein